jgi:glutamyl-Q tRNA(Asp) synthetase
LAPADPDRAPPTTPAGYVGRFAPSPTGPLHFGSLLAAVASYAQAKANQGKWLVRIEDIDPPREKAGADVAILDALEAYGFEWDGAVTYQSTFAGRHEAAVARLVDTGLAYPCSCSRRDLAAVPRGPLGAIYPGTCRNGCRSDDVAIRVRTNDDSIVFTDALQGRQEQRLEIESGDFVIKRRDGLIAYHLAVVIDDHAQGITEIVRGIDLIDSTPRHIWLQQLLGLGVPGYMHIPVAVNEQGQKLSKLTGAAGLDVDHPGPVLVAALTALDQRPPPELGTEAPATIWTWALDNWSPARLAGVRDIQAARFGFG